MGRAEARVAFMPQGGIRCDRVAERDCLDSSIAPDTIRLNAQR